MESHDFIGIAALYGFVREPGPDDRIVLVREDSQNLLISVRRDLLRHVTEEQAVLSLRAAANLGTAWTTAKASAVVQEALGWKVGQLAVLRPGASRGGNPDKIFKWFGDQARPITAIIDHGEDIKDENLRYALVFHTNSGYGSPQNFIPYNANECT